MVLYKSWAKKVLFEWQHQRISSTDLNIRMTNNLCITLSRNGSVTYLLLASVYQREESPKSQNNNERRHLAPMKKLRLLYHIRACYSV